jgi:hypothetical protein
MKNEFTSFWTELFTWLITFLVFGFYTALTFFRLDGNWSFLSEFHYWFSLVSSTTIAWFLRYLWLFKGVSINLYKNKDIKLKEEGKSKVITEITSGNLTDVLELDIKRINKIEKRRQYKIKCERKIRVLRSRKHFKRKLPYWQEELINANSDEFDIDVVKIKYYKYDIDSMLSSTYRPSHEVETRGNINNEMYKSLRVSILTLIGFAVLGAIQLWLKDYTNDDLVLLSGKFLIFVLNMWSGYMMGMKFIDTKYSNDLTKDYTFMKRVIKEKG